MTIQFWIPEIHWGTLCLYVFVQFKTLSVLDRLGTIVTKCYCSSMFAAVVSQMARCCVLECTDAYMQTCTLNPIISHPSQGFYSLQEPRSRGQILSLPWRLKIHLRYLWFAGERHDPGFLGWCGGLWWLGRHGFSVQMNFSRRNLERTETSESGSVFIHVVDQDLHSPRAALPVKQTWASRIGVGAWSRQGEEWQGDSSCKTT